MSVKQYIPAENVWQMCVENEEVLERQMVLIAENKDSGYAVFVTLNQGFVTMSVCRGDAAPEYSEVVLSHHDCILTVEKLVRRYLLPVFESDGKVLYDDSPFDNEEEDAEDEEDELDIDTGMENSPLDDEEKLAKIDYTEESLWIAMRDFLDVAFGEDRDNTTEMLMDDNQIQQAVEVVIQYLIDEGLYDYIYRPMILEDTLKSEKYVEYPYADSEFKVDSIVYGGQI